MCCSSWLSSACQVIQLNSNDQKSILTRSLSSSLFAVSIQHKVMGGNFVWVVMFLIASCTWCSAFLVSDGMKARFDRAEEYTLLSMHAGDPSSDSLEESA